MRFLGAIFAIFGFGPAAEPASDPGRAYLADEATASAALHDSPMWTADLRDQLAGRAEAEDR